MIQFKLFDLLIILNVLLSTSLYAQPITIKGKVIDKVTLEPMIFTNVYIENTTIGTTTDIDGNYIFTIDTLVDSIICSSIGYFSQKKHINKNSTTQIINFNLAANEYGLNEVVIFPGENPANIILKNIIAHKPSNNPNKYDSYQYEAYNKMEIDIDAISEKALKDNKLLKPFAFIFNNVDSTSEDRRFLPVFMTESLSDYYFRKNPRKSREIIKGTKISGIKNESVNQFLGTMYQNFSIYQNWLPVLGKEFASPISDFGLLSYKYELLDTAVYKNHTIYKISFKPKHKQELTFFGDFWVADTTWAIQQMNMQITKDANINFVKEVAIFQSFDLINDTSWFMVKDKLVTVFAATNDDSPGLIGRKTTTYKYIILEPHDIDGKLTGVDDIIWIDGVDNHDEEYWQHVRHDSLSKNEKAIYAMVDTIKEMPMFKTYVDYITIIASGYKIIGPIELGPYFNLYSKNDIEGHRFRLGFRTSNTFSTKYEFGAYMAYGFKDNRLKYGTHGIYVINKLPRRDLSFRYVKDVDVSNPDPNNFGQDNLLSGLYRRPIPQKLSFVHSMSISYLHELKFGYSNKFTLLRKSIIPYFDFSYYNSNLFPLLEINENPIEIAELRLQAHFAYKEKFLSANIYRTSLGSKYPALDIEYTIGMKGFLGSKFSYHKLNVNIYDWFNIPPLGWSEYHIRGGKTFGQLPLLLLDILPGNETYFYNSSAFNLMNMYEFITDQFAYVLWNHHFEGLLLNKIPLLRKLKLRWLVSGKVAWGKMNATNKLINSAPINYLKINTPNPIPYAEASIGLENIFKVIRIDAIWRLTHLELPDASPFGIRAGMQLTF